MLPERFSHDALLPVPAGSQLAVLFADGQAEPGLV